MTVASALVGMPHRWNSDTDSRSVYQSRRDESSFPRLRIPPHPHVGPLGLVGRAVRAVDNPEAAPLVELDRRRVHLEGPELEGRMGTLREVEEPRAGPAPLEP